jgi:hypothetical protein
MKAIYRIETIEDLGNLIKECDETQLESVINSLSESIKIIYFAFAVSESKADIDFKLFYWSPLDKFPSELIDENDKVETGFTIEASKKQLIDND